MKFDTQPSPVVLWVFLALGTAAAITTTSHFYQQHMDASTRVEFFQHNHHRRGQAREATRLYVFFFTFFVALLNINL